MEVLCNDCEELTEDLYEKLEKLCDIAMEQEGLASKEGEVSLSFVSEEEIQQLNEAYRGVDKVTDVLSFPQYESKADIAMEPYAVLGDVIICLDVAENQAQNYGHSLEREICYLFVHSIMHLLGYDHMEDEEKEEMRRAEENVLSKLNITRMKDD